LIKAIIEAQIPFLPLKNVNTLSIVLYLIN
jgi:hypothetical protein